MTSEHKLPLLNLPVISADKLDPRPNDMSREHIIGQGQKTTVYLAKLDGKEVAVQTYDDVEFE